MKILLAILLVAVVLTAGCTQYGQPADQGTDQATIDSSSQATLDNELNDLENADLGTLEDDLIAAAEA